MIKDRAIIHRYNLVIIILFFSSLISCTAKSNILPSTGSPMTAEWKNYNLQAEVNGAPILNYAVTAKRVLKGPVRPQEIQDVFSTRDARVTVFTKWTNIKGNPRYKIKIFDPRGVLFIARSVAYKHRTGIWYKWDDVFIKGWAASRLPGLWRADIYMDGVLVTKKNFIIGSQDTRYEKKIDNENTLKIGVIPFIDHKSSSRKHGRRISLYLAQMLSIDLKHSTIVMPFKLRNNFNKPFGIYEEYKDFLVREINSPGSEWAAASKKHNLDFLITGKAYDQAVQEDDKNMVIYVIDCKTKKIIEVKATYASHAYSGHDISGNEVIRQFYKRVYDKLLKKGISKITG